ncbi:MAG: HAMP domain-containing histidine kinase [Lachnospiraceae bacterium]|nr:HAMP domain-containing histidine kinase [Lachnospiraceae bacterium]
MKSILKLIRRFVNILWVSTILIIVLNIVILAIIASKQAAGRSPWTTAVETAKGLKRTKNGYELSKDMMSELESENVWAICIDNNTHKVVWHTDNLPQEIPMEYSISEIAFFGRGYVKDYPTFTGGTEDGLVVLGYPKERYWKEMYPSWDYDFIANLPKTLLSMLGCNISLIFLIYVITNTKMLKSVRPIAEGIEALPNGEAVWIKEKGILSEIAVKINQTSGILQSQNYQLKKKETARANWIAGVSHDIRTPLSMVMGYAGQLESDSHLTTEEQKKVSVILRQSERIKNLINDLNLASKLEYNMQPVKAGEENVVALVRQVVVEFMNMDIETRYPIVWLTEETFTTCVVNVDGALLKRAMCNLIWNCMNHNENGCSIYVQVKEEQRNCVICVEDDGAGVSDEQIEALNHTPHYMFSDANTMTQRHGLGLLIVKQIMDTHNGETVMGHSAYGGFGVKLILPKDQPEASRKNDGFEK